MEAEKPVIMKFDLQTSVNYILNLGNLAELKAIEFFTLLVVLHRGRPRVKISAKTGTNAESSLVLNVPSKTVRSAKILTAMKFLDRIEQGWKEKTGRDSLDLSELAKIPEYDEIINQVMFANGSWRALRFVYSVRALERKLLRWKKQARNVARIVEFSFRFEFDPKKRKQIGGVTMAIDLVTNLEYFKVDVKKSQLEKSWSDLQSAAPFLYLIYVERYPFFLKRPAGKRLAERLLNMVSDQARLVEFFAGYNQLVTELGKRGYKYSPLQLPANAPSEPLSRKPFWNANAQERAVLDEIESYRKG